MFQPAKQGEALLAEIGQASDPTPAIWWLGHSGFVLKFRQAILYLDPWLSGGSAVFEGSAVRHASLILCSHTHPRHLDPQTVKAILNASPRAKLIIPKSGGAHAHSLGIPYLRMVTTDSGLRVEYLDDRIYAVPSAHNELEWTPLGGYPSLGYLVRFGGYTIYHAGDCIPYETLADRLRPYNVTVALLPISGRGNGGRGNFEIGEAAQLAKDIGARWLAPMHYRLADAADRFVEHMLGHRPEQRFKVFARGEKWVIPED